MEASIREKSLHYALSWLVQNIMESGEWQHTSPKVRLSLVQAILSLYEATEREEYWDFYQTLKEESQHAASCV